MLAQNNQPSEEIDLITNFCNNWYGKIVNSSIIPALRRIMTPSENDDRAKVEIVFAYEKIRQELFRTGTSPFIPEYRSGRLDSTEECLGIWDTIDSYNNQLLQLLEHISMLIDTRFNTALQVSTKNNQLLNIDIPISEIKTVGELHTLLIYFFNPNENKYAFQVIGKQELTGQDALDLAWILFDGSKYHEIPIANISWRDKSTLVITFDPNSCSDIPKLSAHN